MRSLMRFAVALTILASMAMTLGAGMRWSSFLDLSAILEVLR